MGGSLPGVVSPPQVWPACCGRRLSPAQVRAILAQAARIRPGLHHDQKLGLRGHVPVQRADRDIRPVGDLLRRDPAYAAFGEQLAGCGHDALPLVPLGPLPAPHRHATASHGDLP